MAFREMASLIRRTLDRFMEDGAMQFGAALAFYATLSLAPLLLLAVSAITLLARTGVTRAMLLDRLAFLLGDRGADIAGRIVDSAPATDSGIAGVVVSGILLLIGGSVLFVNVQGALNAIWNVRSRDEGILRGIVRARLIAFVMILATGVVLLLSILLGATAAWAAPWVERQLSIAPAIITLLELVVSTAMIAVLCAATYRILPDVEIAWRDVWLGAVLTAVLFLVGRTAIGWYLSQAALASRYGAAGSGVVFLLWVYYSSLIFFFGAEFTQEWAEHRGSPIRPARGAVRVIRKAAKAEPSEH